VRGFVYDEASRNRWVVVSEIGHRESIKSTKVTSYIFTWYKRTADSTWTCHDAVVSTIQAHNSKQCVESQVREMGATLAPPRVAHQPLLRVCPTSIDWVSLQPDSIGLSKHPPST
jgi:hypothetical protein